MGQEEDGGGVREYGALPSMSEKVDGRMLVLEELAQYHVAEKRVRRGGA